MNPPPETDTAPKATQKAKKEDVLRIAKMVFGPRARVGYNAAAGNRWVALRQRIGYRLIAAEKTYDALVETITKIVSEGK